MTIAAHNPAAEANAVLGSGLVARVLEPSPPSIGEPLFADDPATVGMSDEDSAAVVTPTSAGDHSWSDILLDRPELAEWAEARWLGGNPTLPPVPAGYLAARAGFHRLAYSVVAEARRLANTKFGLRYTRGGFGTPFFGADKQVRVEGCSLIVQRGTEVRSAPITTLRSAGELAGVVPGTDAAEANSPALGDLDEDLGATDETGDFLGAWFGFSWAVLEELRLTEGAIDPSTTQLWPGHFDPAIEFGPADTRASYGCSPGDRASDDPYLYVVAPGEVDHDNPYWNEQSFNGASLDYATLLASSDPVATAVEFFRAGHALLSA